MAEFLIYNKTHWFDLPSKSEPDKTGYQRNHDKIQAMVIPVVTKSDRINKLDDQYNARPLVGDIVEVRTDGTGMGKLEPESFVLVKVPEMSEKEARDYTGPLLDDIPSEENMPKTIKQFRFSVDISGIMFTIDGKTTMSRDEFLSLITEKKV